MTFQAWNPDWFALPGVHVFDRVHQQIAAVSRARGKLDLFIVGHDDRVWTTFWDDEVGWNADFFPVPGVHVFDRVNQQIAVVSRAPGNLDLFVIGNDNRVWTTFWNDRDGWNADWFALPGVHVFDRANQEVAVVSRAGGNLDVFVIGNDDRVWTTFWTEQGGWNADFFPVPGVHVFDRVNQQLAVVSRAPGNLDLFVIGNDDHVWTTFWTEQGGWNADFFPVPGVHVFDRVNQRIAAVSRAPGNLDLFVIGNDDRVWTTFWTEQGGWNADFFPVPGVHVFDRVNQQIAAVSRAPGNLDLFVIGNDNRVWTTFWNDRDNWNADWFPLPGVHVFDRVNQQIAAVSRSQDWLQLFVVGNDNHVWTSFWGPRVPMTLEVKINQTSATVPLQVGLQIAASEGIVFETKFSVTKNGVLEPGIGESIPAGIALDRILAVNDAGSYVITVSRAGLTGPGPGTTLTKQFNITAQAAMPPPSPAPLPPAPQIGVTFSGSISNVRFHVKGSGFLANRPDTTAGIGIRIVDANVPILPLPTAFTGSSAEGKIDRTVERDLTRLTLNALGIGTVAISATDGRPNPADSTGFLWSNTVRIDFSG